MTGRLDEFDWIDRLKPLTRGDPSALGLNDDAAVIAGKAGHELVVSKDAMVEGVHFHPGESAARVARRLLRTSLSDLAAKAARPFGYFLMVAWPPDRTRDDQEAFISGLAEDGEVFGVALLGGDTVSTPGPLTLSATVLGWAPTGETVLRSGARAGDVIMVCGVIGDGWLGLKASLGELGDPSGDLTRHYLTPTPLLVLERTLRRYAKAAADVSDGLLADVDHIARASGLGIDLELERLPLSRDAADWRAGQVDASVATLALATGGDDYAIVCAVTPTDEAAFRTAVSEHDIAVERVGVFSSEVGLRVEFAGRPVHVAGLGWRH
jgi:thiamine-monophosphate kinase